MMIAQSGSLALMAGMIAALCVTPATAAVTISTDATANMSCVSGVCTPTAADAVLKVGDLTTMLASGNVTVNTGTGSLPQQVEDIIVAAPFNWASANALTLDAYRSISVGKRVADNGTASLTLLTDDGGTSGSLSFAPNGSISFLGTSNALTINGNAYTLESSLAALAGAIASNPSGFYALAGDYNATPDGTYSHSPISIPFEGTFEGLGNTISNLSITDTQDNSVGLFAELGSDTAGTLRDISLRKVSVESAGSFYNEAGALVGVLNGGSVVGCSATGVVNAYGPAAYEADAGGLVGVNYGTVSNSFSAVKTSVAHHPNCSCDKAGGLVGNNNSGVVELSGATGPVISGDMAGGLVGYNVSDVPNGGIVDQSFATGKVSGGTAGGGLAGFSSGNAAEIYNSYSTGDVSGGGAGGFDGGNYGDAIFASYSTGKVKASEHKHGGGFAGSGPANFSDDYWDTTTSHFKKGVGGDGDAPGVTGLTTTQLQSGLPTGFDPTIWAESPSINNGFPYLTANPPQ